MHPILTLIVRLTLSEQSGWNRLIDELRCIWHPNCKSGYVEVGSDSSWVSAGLSTYLSKATRKPLTLGLF